MNKRRDCAERFLERYSAPIGRAAAEVERNVIGVSMGANGYTTARQAELLARRLDLGPGMLVLDLGSGRGWPSLYLAARTGCHVVLADLPQPALAAAIRRADEEGIADRVSVNRASATRLPFKPRQFDAITHTDSL